MAGPGDSRAGRAGEADETMPERLAGVFGGLNPGELSKEQLRGCSQMRLGRAMKFRNRISSLSPGSIETNQQASDRPWPGGVAAAKPQTGWLFNRSSVELEPPPRLSR